MATQKSRSAAHEERNKALRAGFASPDAARKASPPTAATVEAKAKDLKLDHEVEEIPKSDGARVHWLGDRTARKVWVYLHGGGYGLPAFEGHILFLEQCLRYVSSKGKQMCIAFLEYSLTREKKYPVQIWQASEALRLVLAKGFAPSDIIVGGDSAGGGLGLALFSHLLHPLSGIPPLKLEQPLAGLLLISPWVCFDTDTPSWASNDNDTRDIVSSSTVNELSADWVLPHERNNWSEPFYAEPSWWHDMPVKAILNICGSFECFRDHVKGMGEKLQTAGIQVVTVECPLHVHIDCVLDAQTNLESGFMAVTIWEWLDKVL